MTDFLPITLGTIFESYIWNYMLSSGNIITQWAPNFPILSFFFLKSSMPFWYLIYLKAIFDNSATANYDNFNS